MMKKRLNRKGFTLAEVLIVVAIIVILAGVGAVALFSHARTMQQLEMDGNAKEIFIAAQNHLTMAEGQGYLGKTDDAAFGTLAEDDVYYFLVGTGTDPNDKNLVLSQMLPFAAVDETVRLGGSYIIRYQRSTGTVLDVFYSSKGTRYSYDFSGDGSYASVMALRDVGGADHKKDRRDIDGKVLGWYGGADPATLKKGEPLEPPTLEIINAEYLKVIVHDYNEYKNGGNNTVQLIVTGKQSGVQRVFALKGPADGGVYQANPGTNNRIYNNPAKAGDYEILLDSVTGQDKDRHFNVVNNAAKDFLHFSSLDGFIPGENLELKAVVLNNEVLTNVAESPAYATNSLFAQAARNGGSESAPEFTVSVSNFRHLINLEKTLVSGVNITVKTVDQINDLVWQSTEDSFLTKTGAAGVTMADGNVTTGNCFLPVWLDSIVYDGHGHSVSNLIITATGGIPAKRVVGSNEKTNDLIGLFGCIDGGEVRDLNLIDFNVTGATGDTGALAGKVTGNASISGVLVNNSKTGDQDDSAYAIIGTGVVGGLVGTVDAASVDKCAAAVYVSGGSSVGGLIGKTVNAVAVSDSYSGGHTYDKKYQETKSGDGHVNVIATGVAGGLIGDASASTLTLGYSYSTASSSGATAGGLIGKGGSGTVSYCYATGLVLADDADKKGAFIGEGASGLTLTEAPDPDDETKTVPTNYYLESVSENASQPELRLVGAFAGDKSYPAFLIPTEPSDQRRPAVTYDTKLSARYDFPTISQLHGTGYSASDFASSFTTVHYGDWYLPNMEILYYTIVNDNTLYTEITLKEHTRLVTVAVYGETSKAAKAFLLEVAEDKSSVNLIDMGTLVGNDIRWTGAPAAGTNLPAYGISGTDTKKVTVTMDDITTEKKHFASIFPDLLPGENITVLAAGGNCGWPELQTLRQKTYPDDMEGAGRIIALSDNSLFAKPTDLKNAAVNYSNDSFKALLASVSNAEIINIRHLQNLDTSVSNVNADSAHKTATAAKLMNDINWTSEEWNDIPAAAWWRSRNIYKYNSDTKIAAGHFNGIVNTYLTGFDGNNKTIKGMVIENTFGEGAGHAGFFRRVDNSKLTIQKLHLDSPSITAQSGSAGAFIGLNNGDTKLDKVLAEGDANYEIKALSGSAGGLVGYSQRTLNITNSAASMLVTGSGAAGGLVGQQTGDTGELKISKSYVGGHTYGGVYYVNADAAEDATADVNGVDADSHERWNVISTGGAAGGLLGLLDAKATLEIEESFNAASVYSGAVASTGAAGGIIGAANGTISKLNLVYVVAPVSDVKEIKEVDDELVPEEGNAGSVIGISSKEFAANSSAGSGVYFLANVYSTPMPTMLDTSVSNIKTIGSGTLKNIKLAYYYVKAGQDNAILPYVHSDVMEQRTDSFDGSLGEYPFAIWTKFAFDGSDILHFYGDWQPAEKGPTIHLDVEFYTVLPADETTGAARVAKHLTARDQEIAVQIPYEGAAIQLPWPEDVFNYNFGDWAFYYGEQGSKVLSDSAIDASDTSATVFSKSKNGFNVYMSVTDFKKLNQDKYKTTDENGETHLHITLVSTYVKRENPLYKLEFFDAKFKTTAEGTEELDGFESEPLTYQVLEPQPNEDPALAKVTLDQLVEGKQPPTRNKAGFRFLGWYLKNGENYTPIYENKFDTATNSFGLVLNETEAAKVKVDHNIQLYARYEAIPYRTINVTFVDGDGNQIPSVEPYQIRFEGDRGFKETVIPLPYTENILYPDAEQTPVVTGKSDSDTIEWTLTGANPTVKIAIVPVSAVTDSNREINCKVTYNVQADYTGYVVLYELLDTSKTSASTYSAGDSYIYSYDLSKDYLYGTTIVGYSPTVDVETDDRFENYLLTKQPEGFEISGARVVKQNGDGAFPEKYSGKYPTDAITTDKGDLGVTYLVVIQCRRVSSWLTFDTQGGGNIAPVKLVYGRPLNDILKNADGVTNAAAYVPTYAGYTFTKWVYMGKDADGNDIEVDAAGTTMPGHDLQLIAKREGDPAKFTVLIWLQNPNDNEYALGKYYEDTDQMANAGSDIEVEPSQSDKRRFTLSWKNEDDDVSKPYNLNGVNGLAELEYFHLNKATTDKKVTVSGDGSTVVNLYYDRNLYTIWFLIGRATGGEITTKVGLFDSTGTYPVSEYTGIDGTKFYAYIDEENGVPYGVTPGGRFATLVKDGETTVTYYKPNATYTSNSSPDTNEQLYGINAAGDYIPLTRRTKTDGEEHFLVQDQYSTVEYIGRIYNAYGYEVTNPVYDNTYYRKNNGGHLKKLYWQTRNNTTYYWTDSTSTAYENRYETRFTQGGYSGDLLTADDVTDHIGALYFLDGNGGYVPVSVDHTVTEPKYKLGSEDYTGEVYYLVIEPEPKNLNVQEFKADDYTKYYVTQYQPSTYSEMWYADERVQIGSGSEVNPFSGIPANKLHLVTEKVDDGRGGGSSWGSWGSWGGGGFSTPTQTEFTSFYYAITARYGEEIADQWPDVKWLIDHNLGILTYSGTENRFTSWLVPSTSKYYETYRLTMTSIKGKYATMSEHLILNKFDGSTSYSHSPDNSSGNNPTIKLQGRYRPKPNYWNYVIKKATGGKNPIENPTAGDSRVTWDTVTIRVYSDGPSKNQNPIVYTGYNSLNEPEEGLDEIKSEPGNDIEYYYVPITNPIIFKAITTTSRGEFVELNDEDDDRYYYESSLVGASSEYDSQVYVPTGHEFKGWYQDPLGAGEPFDFTETKMPLGDLILYAITKPTDKTVTFTLTKPTDAAGTVMWAKANPTDPDDTADRTFANVSHNSTLVSRIDAFVSAHGGAAFEPVLEGYRFTGWVEQGTNTAFAPSQQIIKDYTLVPDWEKLPDPVHKTVTVKYVKDADHSAAVHDPTTVDVIVDDTYKFVAQSVNGYKPETSYYYETIDNAWLEEHKVAGTENQYEVTFYYNPADNTWNYTVQYNLYLTPVNGGAAAEIPLQTGTETSSSNFAAVSFFTLPDSMKGYKVANLKLFEGSTQVDSTTDPIIFVKKAENVTLVVNVVPDDSLILQGEVVRTYNAKPQGVESEFESSLPTLPSGVAFVRTVAYSYNGSETKPTNVGAYQVGVTVTVTYNDVVYFYWESATASASRPDMVLYIDPCDVIVTSESVTNVFLNTLKNQTAKKEGKLPVDADNLADIVRNLTAGAAKDTNVEISVSGSDSTDILAKLNGSDGLLISPSADAFRRAGSKGPDDYTTNTFYCEMKNSADNANFNFYKVYGKLYIWEDLDAYNKWKNPGT